MLALKDGDGWVSAPDDGEWLAWTALEELVALADAGRLGSGGAA